jgi:hypothetical protein
MVDPSFRSKLSHIIPRLYTAGKKEAGRKRASALADGAKKYAESAN